jgi:hypothetical protein
MKTSSTRLGTGDLLVLLGLFSLGAALWFLAGWVGVLALCGTLLIAVGVAEARNRKG